MFGRVAAWGFAVFLAILPARSGVEPNTPAFLPAPTAVVAVAAPRDSAATEAQTVSQDRAAIDTPAARLAALEPAAPAVSVPPLAEPFGLAAFGVNSGDVLAKWSTVRAQIGAESEILARCR